LYLEEITPMDNSHYIIYYPEMDLPKDAQSRFQQLFSVKSKWDYQAIIPYIQ
jgi:Sister chromatid cohesion protein Dcc1